MRRIDVYITENQLSFLSTLPGTISEHVRRALDDYIQKMRVAKASASKSKKGDQNGQSEPNTTK